LDLYDAGQKSNWKRVAKRMRKYNVFKTNEQCRYKFANLKKSYFCSQKRHNLQHMQYNKNARNWGKLHEIFGNEANGFAMPGQRPNVVHEIDVPSMMEMHQMEMPSKMEMHE
jgi:hypothetical protein